MPYIPPPGQVDHISGEVEPPPQPAEPQLSQPRRRGRSWTLRMTPAGFSMLVVINVVILGGLAYGMSRALDWSANRQPPSVTLDAELLAGLSETPGPPAGRTPTPTSPAHTSTPNLPVDLPTPFPVTDLAQGLILLALDDGGNSHLFAYQPQIGRAHV